MRKDAFFRPALNIGLRLAAGKETKTSRAISGSEWGADVLDALARAARHLAWRDPAAHLFLERRFERRLELGPEGVVAATAARVQGLVAEPAPGSGVFLSVPRLDALEDLAITAARGVVPDPVPEGAEALGPTPEPPLAALEALRRSAGEAARLQYVEIDQQVAVARRDGRAGMDRRRGRRLRLALGSTVVERALPGEEGGLEVEGLAAQVAERAEARKHLLPAWTGRTPVVFAQGVGGALFHELIGHALEGDVQVRSASRLARSEGRIAPAAVTVLDDPRRSRVPWTMDDEGTMAEPVALLQEGHVRGRLTSWGWPGPPHPSSGHARRASFAEPALPRMGATFLTPGQLHPEAVREGVARGIYVHRMVSAATDPAEGKATFEVTDADMLIAGRIEGPLAPVLLHVSLEDLLTLDRIADDLTFDVCVGVCVREGQAMASSVGAPTFRLGLVTVTG